VRDGANALPSLSEFSKHGIAEGKAKVTSYVRSDETMTVLTYKEGEEETMPNIESLLVISDTTSFLFQGIGGLTPL
jgi:hypothetical protein